MLAFSDGLFAIAMTLLVVGITVPVLKDASSVKQLADALNDLIPNFISFFISFAVIGRYWIAHHHQFSMLEAIDTRLISLNLLYLAFIAFLPFPTALLGEYFENPLSVVMYATTVAIVSGFEVVMFSHARRAKLLNREIPDDVYRFGMIASGVPVLFFLLSIPFAFVLSSGWAVGSWYLMVIAERIGQRWKPAEADRYLA